MFIEFIKYLVQSQWLYIAYAVPVFIFFILFYLINKKELKKTFTGFINWIRPSFETGGFASPEKITAFIVTTFGYIPGNLIYMLSDADKWHKLGALGISAVFVLVLFRIITPQQLLELKEGIKPSQSNVVSKPEN